MNIARKINSGEVLQEDLNHILSDSLPISERHHSVTFLNIEEKISSTFDFRQTVRLKFTNNFKEVIIVEEGGDDCHITISVGDTNCFYITPANTIALTVNGGICEGKLAIENGDWIYMHSCLFQIQIPTFAAAHKEKINQLNRQPLEDESETLPVANKDCMLVGRLPECDLLIDSPLVSRIHAKITQAAGRVFIEDCQSTNGTFLNTVRISKKEQIQPGDHLCFAGFAYLFNGTSINAINIPGQVEIVAHQLTKEVQNKNGDVKRILDNISFVIHPGEFVGIFGTSGSGKSTLLDALNGRRKTTSGNVYYNGLDLLKTFDLFRTTIGYVPQQDIVHRKITLRNAIRYTAEMRLPIDTTPDELHENVARVVDKVGLSEKALLPVDTPIPLSGGQFKRVSLAIELVSNPNVLFLDEVTSGLDAGNDKRMMQLFRTLAENWKTVVCVTHTLENIDTCHLVLLLHRGKLIFYGPPQSVAEYFGVKRMTDIYELLEKKLPDPDYWQNKYKNSDLYKSFITKRIETSPSHDSQISPAQPTSSPRYDWDLTWRQTKTLISRYSELILSDRRNLLILVLQAPVIAIIIGIVYRSDKILAVRAVQECQISFILVISSIWFGCLNSVRELVKELPIYLRERSVNLQLGPYLISKLVPLSMLCFIQCVLLLLVVQIFIHIEGDLYSRFAILYVTSVAAMSMGLCVSSIVNATDKALAIAPMLLIPQVILSGAIFDLHEIGLKVAKFTIIAYWSYDAIKATLSESVVNAIGVNGKTIVQLSGTIQDSLFRIIFLYFFFLILSIIGLKLKDFNKN